LIAADHLSQGKLSVFGSAIEQKEFTWNADPLSGVEAPIDFGKLIDYRNERVVGNIKYLWEPNRHLELVTLAQAFALTSEARYLNCISQRLASWLTQCPYPRGVNWSSSLELGIRLINWSLVWQLVGGQDSAMFKPGEEKGLLDRWLASIYQHVHFICHYYSRHSSANNHLIGEAAGVLIATCTWPYWKEFDGWREEARQILIREADAQTYADGVNREQAIAYQQFVLDFLILAGLAGRAHGYAFPDSYWRNIERMIEYIQAVMDVGGNIPMIGDADDGFVVRLSQEPDFCPFRSLLATGAVLFDRPDFAVKAGKLDDKTRFLLGADSWDKLIAPSESLDEVRRSFPEGGYYILGQDLETEQEIRILADAGPLGYLSIAAHGHADALSFVLSVAGREILVDPGTYSYHTDPVWREYFRGTRAHNTVCVDGRDQSLQGGNFMWVKHAHAKCTEFWFDENESKFSGEHDGYKRLTDPVLHRRHILQRKNLIRVTDTLTCNNYHRIERCWHFSEMCDVITDGTLVTAQNGPVTVTLRSMESSTEVIAFRGSEDPPAGWVSRRFDVKVPSTSVFFVNEVNNSTQLTTELQIQIGTHSGPAISIGVN
jgi:hypothetical protein